MYRFFVLNFCMTPEIRFQANHELTCLIIATLVEQMGALHISTATRCDLPLKRLKNAENNRW